MLAAFSALEKKLRAFIAELDTEGRAEYERLLAAVKAEGAADLAKVRVIAGDLEAGLGKAVESAGPSVTAAVNAEVGRFLAALAPLLAEAATEI
jgi:hypothetical protein